MIKKFHAVVGWRIVRCCYHQAEISVLLQHGFWHGGRRHNARVQHAVSGREQPFAECSQNGWPAHARVAPGDNL